MKLDVKKLVSVSLIGVLAIALVACSTASGTATDSPMELSAGEGDGMMSCLPFDPEVLATFPVAFEGTVTSVDGDRVTLDVDRWFTGGDGEQVVVVAPQGLEALIGGIAFEVGGQYLVSASDGVVNYCGFSGESTPELRAGFEAAFEG